MGLHLTIIAGETSGDLLGARLITALKRQVPDVVFSGVGGTEMTKAGIQSVFPMDDISVMGLQQILPRLKLIYRRIDETVESIIKSDTDAVIFIDSPEFAIRVAKRIRQVRPDLPMIKYGAPTVWGWRPGRAKAIKPYYNLILALLPFEPRVYQYLDGSECRYVGHPAVANLPTDKHVQGFKNKFSIAEGEQILALLPGSRKGEVNRLSEPFIETLSLLEENNQKLRVFIPAVPNIRVKIEQALKKKDKSLEGLQITLIEGETDKLGLFGCATAALAASGTVSLELALAGVPTVIGYDIDRVMAYFVIRVARTPSVVMPNLILDKPVIPEFLLHRCTPENLSTALQPLLNEASEERTNQIEAFKTLKDIMTTETDDPSSETASQILDFLG